VFPVCGLTPLIVHACLRAVRVVSGCCLWSWVRRHPTLWHMARSATPDGAGSFEAAIVPHLDAAYRLARWLLRHEHDAEDAVQEASLRALRYFHTFTGGNGRAWFLRIVRNVCWNWRAHDSSSVTDPFDEERHSSPPAASDPELRLMQIDDVALIDRAMRNLPGRGRELLVLRELEGLSYQELADVIGIPIGTVMSGLSRARQAFRAALDRELQKSGVSTGPGAREQEGREAVSVS